MNPHPQRAEQPPERPLPSQERRDQESDWPSPREIVERFARIDERHSHNRWLIGVITVPLVLAILTSAVAIAIAVTAT